jgi:hypothetical protein
MDSFYQNGDRSVKKRTFCIRTETRVYSSVLFVSERILESTAICCLYQKGRGVYSDVLFVSERIL